MAQVVLASQQSTAPGVNQATASSVQVRAKEQAQTTQEPVPEEPIDPNVITLIGDRAQWQGKDLNVEYYESGKVKRLYLDSLTYVYKKEKKNNKIEEKSYVPYEVEFTEEGVLSREVYRDTYRSFKNEKKTITQVYDRKTKELSGNKYVIEKYDDTFSDGRGDVEKVYKKYEDFGGNDIYYRDYKKNPVDKNAVQKPADQGLIVRNKEGVVEYAAPSVIKSQGKDITGKYLSDEQARIISGYASGNITKEQATKIQTASTEAYRAQFFETQKFNENLKQKVESGTATAADLIPKGGIQLTPENIAAVRQNVAANEYNAAVQKVNKEIKTSQQNNEKTVYNSDFSFSSGVNSIDNVQQSRVVDQRVVSDLGGSSVNEYKAQREAEVERQVASANEAQQRLNSKYEYIDTQVKKVPGLGGDNYLQKAVRAVPKVAFGIVWGQFEQGYVGGRKIGAAIQVNQFEKEFEDIPEGNVGSEFLRSAKETPGTVIQSFNPKEPEGLVNLGLLVFPFVKGAVKAAVKPTVPVEPAVVLETTRTGSISVQSEAGLVKATVADITAEVNGVKQQFTGKTITKVSKDVDNTQLVDQRTVVENAKGELVGVQKTIGTAVPTETGALATYDFVGQANTKASAVQYQGKSQATFMDLNEYMRIQTGVSAAEKVVRPVPKVKTIDFDFKFNEPSPVKTNTVQYGVEADIVTRPVEFTRIIDDVQIGITKEATISKGSYKSVTSPEAEAFIKSQGLDFESVKINTISRDIVPVKPKTTSSGASQFKLSQQSAVMDQQQVVRQFVEANLEQPKPKVKPVEPLVAMQRSEQEVQLRNAQAQEQVIRTVQTQSFETSVASDVSFASAQDYQLASASMQRSSQESLLSQVYGTESLQRSAQLPATQQMQRLSQDSVLASQLMMQAVPVSQTQSRPRTFADGFLQLPSKKKKRKQEFGYEQGFDVFMKRFGKFQKQNNQSLTRSEALNLGIKNTNTSAGATFELVQTNARVKSRASNFDPRQLERYYQKNVGGRRQFVEKTRFRINTSGELRDITGQARRKRRY